MLGEIEAYQIHIVFVSQTVIRARYDHHVEVFAGSDQGIGKPEPLKGDLSGWWSRRIDDTHRLVYRIRDGRVEIAQCRTHYGD